MTVRVLRMCNLNKIDLEAEAVKRDLDEVRADYEALRANLHAHPSVISTLYPHPPLREDT